MHAEELIEICDDDGHPRYYGDAIIDGQRRFFQYERVDGSHYRRAAEVAAFPDGFGGRLFWGLVYE